jgi:predicted LPLAT superfamily acyltransferase
VKRIKIGFASDFEAQFASMRTDSPVALVPLLVERGTRKTERRYHSRFAEFRRNGEWFEATRQLLVFIASRAAKQKESG